jgi:hypothetical protein
MAAAGTGAGKSMVFALLAIATELAKSSGLVIVVCPLKALQHDQCVPSIHRGSGCGTHQYCVRYHHRCAVSMSAAYGLPLLRKRAAQSSPRPP